MSSKFCGLRHFLGRNKRRSFQRSFFCYAITYKSGLDPFDNVREDVSDGWTKQGQNDDHNNSNQNEN